MKRVSAGCHKISFDGLTGALPHIFPYVSTKEKTLKEALKSSGTPALLVFGSPPGIQKLS
jgi:hypothetical protein